MCRYECKSKLNISCQANSGSREKKYIITICLEHHKRHTPYYNISLSPKAAEMIHENLEWTCPSEIAKKVQLTYPAISVNQVHKAWMTMSKTLWKRNVEQLPSVRTLLSNLKDDMDILNLLEMEGVEQIAWVMKKIIFLLQGKIVEVGIDATCKKTLNHQKLTH